MPAAKKTSPDEARIREIAHELWEKAGRPEGESEKFWFDAVGLAEAEQKPKRKPAAKKTAKPKAAAKSKAAAKTG